ncbi:hypothetical protein PENTCL1PPCAC_9484, partial [Pristionchus entomophagus]
QRVSAEMFGSKPAFGASNTSFGSSGTSLFGQTKPATSLFGQPQQQQPQQTSSLFGAKPAGTGLFGQTTTNNATTGSSLFGSTAANTSGGGLFGQSKPSLFGASTANSSFGQTSTSLFGGTTGATTGATSLFGSTAAAVPTGSTVKFEPVIGQDTMQKNGTNSQISTKHMCITAMKQYESKCIEELRVEDYMAGRKAPAPGTTTTGGLFGSKLIYAGGGLFGSSTPQQKSIFGSTTAAAPTFGATTGSTSIFGSPAQPASTGTSLFGAKPPGTTSLFGSTTAPAAGTSLFGATTAGPAATTSLFGQPAATTTFGQPAAPTSLFGAPAASTATSGFSFGAPATSTAGAGFGATTSMFGAPASTAGATSLFGAKPATTSAFSFGQPTTTTTASPFGECATTTAGGGLFGAKPATTFGQPGTGLVRELFGAPAAQPQQAGIGLFGAAQPQMGAFGAQQAAAAPIVQQVAAAPIELVTNVTQAQMEMALINAQLAASPYGDSPMFNVKEAKKDTDDKPNPTSFKFKFKFIYFQCAAPAQVPGVEEGRDLLSPLGRRCSRSQVEPGVEGAGRVGRSDARRLPQPPHHQGPGVLSVGAAPYTRSRPAIRRPRHAELVDAQPLEDGEVDAEGQRGRVDRGVSARQRRQPPARAPERPHQSQAPGRLCAQLGLRERIRESIRTRRRRRRVSRARSG